MKPSSSAAIRGQRGGRVVLMSTLALSALMALTGKLVCGLPATAADDGQRAPSGRVGGGGELTTSSSSLSGNKLPAPLVKGGHLDEVSIDNKPLESIANAKIQHEPRDMSTAAGHHYGKSHGGHGKYYMYAESPKKGAYKMGFKRGNKKHTIERKESAYKSHVHSYFKWHDKKGKGSHKFEFKHSGKKHHY